MRFCLAIIIAACLVACRQSVLNPAPAEQVQAPDSVPEKRKTPARAVMLERLLEQADMALARDRLTIPADDNAYDIYRAAQLLDPESSRAQAGLDAVLLTLVSLARDELARGRLERAQVLQETARERFPDAPLLAELTEEFEDARAKRVQEQARTREALAADNRVHLIPPEFLRDESEAAKQWFAAVAETIKAADSSILIYARSDAEGRKIYRLLKSGVTDYLLRGDIRIGTPTRIQEMEPLP